MDGARVLTWKFTSTTDDTPKVTARFCVIRVSAACLGFLHSFLAWNGSCFSLLPAAVARVFRERTALACTNLWRRTLPVAGGRRYSRRERSKKRGRAISEIEPSIPFWGEKP
ncbi:hypothetical protein LBW62_00775 [Ralstonia solanacearum]|uniref:hypothetical protein n=1 Tax=Ralstonia solanacearum TaxID=305 RepID=UPI0023059BDC|nr:hypothetical protein [Ralstonia solanacearum]MDB0554734.1 hypothetical protein [Ralstonia solanacearum]